MISTIEQLPDALAVKLAHAGDLIVFDGECVLCSGFFRFVLRHDRQRRFSFVLAQSPLGRRLYHALDLNAQEFETNLVVVDGRIHAKGRAFTAVMAALGWPWRLTAAFDAVPRAVVDPVYDRIARNRYRIFGRHKACLIPDAELRGRFAPGGGAPGA